MPSLLCLFGLIECASQQHMGPFDLSIPIFSVQIAPISLDALHESPSVVSFSQHDARFGSRIWPSQGILTVLHSRPSRGDASIQTPTQQLYHITRPATEESCILNFLLCSILGQSDSRSLYLKFYPPNYPLHQIRLRACERISQGFIVSMPVCELPSHCGSSATSLCSMSSSRSVDCRGMCLMFSVTMPSSYAKLLSLCIEPFIPVLPTTFSPTWLTQRLLQPLDFVLWCLRRDCAILENNFLDQLQPIDLLALQADWVDDYCPEEEGLGVHDQEETGDRGVDDEKVALERFPSSSIYSHLDGPDIPA